jgi:hypothetical protein
MKQNHTGNFLQLVWLAVIILLFCATCEYAPEGEYHVEVKKITDAPELKIKLNFDSDTLYIAANYNTTVEYSTTDPLVKYASFFLNDNQLAISGPSGFFYIQYDNSKYQIDVPYILEVSFFRSSGSGSLADKLESEGFLYSREIVVYFVNEEIMVPQITSVINEKGRLKITWERYNGFGFKNYYVRLPETANIAIISDQNITSCYYDGYIGYGTVFEVLTDIGGNYLHSRYFNVDPELPVLKANIRGGDTILFTWDKSKFSENILGYKVYELFWQFGKLNEIANITDPSDTSFLYNAKFCVRTRYMLEIIPKTAPVFPYDYASTTSEVMCGINIENRGFPSSARGIYGYMGGWVNGYYRLYKYNTENRTATDSMPIPSFHTYCSYNGKWLLNSGNFELNLIDAENMQLIRTYKPDGFMGEEGLPGKYLIANTGIGLLAFPSGNYYYYDFINDAVVKKFNIYSSPDDHMEISPDGNFLAVETFISATQSFRTSLYHFTGDSIELVWQNTPDNFDFDSEKNSFVYFKDGQLIHLSLPDLSVTKTLNLPQGHLYSLDWNRREFLFLNQERDMFSVRGLESGEILAEVETYKFGDSFSAISLMNKTLYTPERMMILSY